jgi:bifunctional non-homologous end joining protein LigD
MRLHLEIMFFKYVEPCSPALVKTVPAGDDWQYEITFDAFRVRIHKLDGEMELYSRSGAEFSRRFPRLVQVVRELSAIVQLESLLREVP